ncbi:MAG TPA: class I SAM-dependent methyltransferase, partial [Anaerolineales bacterium]|nr:class I SAM-dependent methyltransferase [Anaerolineales bacterium]
MSAPPQSPDPDLLYRLYADHRSQALRLGLMLDVFTPLESGGASAQEVAEACGCDPVGMAALLDLLASLELIRRDGATYLPTPTSSVFLVPRKRSYAGRYLLAESGASLWDGISQALRSGQPSRLAFPWAQDAWLESYRASRPEESRAMWRAAGLPAVPRSGSLRVLDLACGCSIKSFVLLEDDPSVHLTCVDSHEVLEVARDLARRMGVLDRVSFLEGGLDLDLAAGAYDAALLGQVTYHLDPDQMRQLARRLHAALDRGGMLLLDAIMADETLSEVASYVTLVTWGVSGGSAHSFEAYRGWLREAG